MRWDKRKPPVATEKPLVMSDAMTGPLCVNKHPYVCVTDRGGRRVCASCAAVDFNCASTNQRDYSGTLQGDRRGTKNKFWANHWAYPVLGGTELSQGFQEHTPIPPRSLSFPGFFFNLSFHLSPPSLRFPSLSLSPRFDFSYSLSLYILMLSVPPSLLLAPCRSAHLGCLLELGTSVPVRGAQWGPVEDTKGGLLQLPVTLRPIQQLFGVYSSVLNPHTQPYHKGTSLAPTQRSPPLAPS